MQDVADDMRYNQSYSTHDSRCEDELESDPEARKRKAQRLGEALAVLAIRPPSFNSLYSHGKLDSLKKLLETSVKERIDSYSERQELLELGLPVPPPKTMKASSKVGNEEYTPFIDETADLPTIHEAYQYLVKVYVENPVELKKKRKMGALKTGAVSGFTRGKSADKSKKIEAQKSTEIVPLEDEPQDEESLKLLSQINDLVGTLGVEDPLTAGGSRRGSRRGSRVPAGDALEIIDGGGSRSRRGSFVGGSDSLGLGENMGGNRSRRGSRFAQDDDDGNKSRRASHIPGAQISNAVSAINAAEQLNIGRDKKHRRSQRKKRDKKKKSKQESNDAGGDNDE